jgi:acetyl-CoA carboxylase carboxyl transferase subunit beta
LSAQARIEQLLDHGSFAERDAGLESEDPLGFVDQKAYPDRIAAAQLATGMRDAAVWGTGTIDGRPVVVAVMDFGFMGGSMGAVVGEKVTRAAEHALASRTPLLVVSASGGARMQEGTLSLMQLAKTVAALERLRAAGVPFLSLLSDPTTGGVFASFAVLGDVNLAEPNALIGFAGARVSAGTIAQELPPGFQRSEFLFGHGFLDRVVHRSELRSEISALLAFLVARPTAAADEDEANDTIGLPAFRPLSFLTTLAERVLPPEPDVEPSGNGTGNGAGPAPVEAPAAREAEEAPRG